jgi:signal transduction histidine kinase
MKATIEALQAELTENRTLIQVMLDCIPGLVYRASHQADGESRLHFVSDSANEIAGMAASHLTGDIRTLFDHVHPEDRPGLIAGLVHSGEQLCTWRHTYRFVHPRKGLRWQKVVAIPNRRHDGTLEWFGHIQDVSELREANTQLERRNRLLQTLDAAKSHWIEQQDIRAACAVLMEHLLHDAGAPFACVFETSRDKGGPRHLHLLTSHELLAGSLAAETADSRVWATALNPAVRAYLDLVSHSGAVHPQPLPHPTPDEPDEASTTAFPMIVHGELIGVLCLSNCERASGPTADEVHRSLLSSLSQLLQAHRLHLRLHNQSRELTNARSRLMASDGLIQAAMASMTHGMCIIDPHGFVVAYNQLYLDLLDLPRELLESRPLHQAVVDFQMQRGDFGPSCELVSGEARGYVRANAGWTSSPDRYLRRTRDGRALEIRSRRLEEGGLVRTYTDVTDRMNLIQEVQHLNANLQQQVAEQTHNLSVSLENLETLSFALAHDLRAPIRSIDGLAMILGEDAAPPQRDSLRKIQSLAQSMGSMIGDMLDLIRSGQQSLHFEYIDTGQLVRSVVDTVVPPSLNAAATVHPLPHARADKTMLTHVFINLIDNAFKYSSSRASPKIDIGFDEAEQAFFVRDNGIGFDMAATDQLFRLFGRLHANEGIPGSGVGLATCAQMVARHGGKIWATSEPDQGATFWVRLPFSCSKARDERSPVPAFASDVAGGR